MGVSFNRMGGESVNMHINMDPLPWLLILMLPGFTATEIPVPTTVPGMMNQVCQFDTFDADCGQHQVIVMETARFGRMETGRCIRKMYGVEGCVVEMRAHLDRICSGRERCKVPVPDETMRKMNQCPSDLASFLQASYHCHAVAAVSADACFAGGQLVLDGRSGYLSSEHAQRSGQGSADCPWELQALPGQRINITLLDFHTPEGTTLDNEVQYKQRHSQSSYCQRYATIHEKEHTTRKNTVCGDGEREKVVYMSATNIVHIEIAKYNSPKKTPFFLLKFEAVGCPMLHPPNHGWLEQTETEATAGCNHTQHMWHLQCDRNRWVGTYHNCTGSQGNEESSTLWAVFSDEWSSPVGILIVSGLGVALGLVIGMAMLSVVLLLMKKNRSTCCIGEPVYEETRQDSDDHNGGGYDIENKHNSNAALVDQMELVSMPETYGAMWRSRPPSYTPPTESSDTQTTRMNYNVGSTSSTRSSEMMTPRVVSRVPDVHLYESPKPSRREFITADLSCQLSDRDVS